VEADGKPGIDDDQNGYVDDINGWDFIAHQDPITFGVHATHLAGTLVADPGGGQVQGMAPEAKIISAGFIDEQNGGSIADAVLAIEYVIQRGAQVVNMSWGGAAYSQPLYDVIAEHPNVLFVTEAGNDGVDLAQSPDYPASFHLPNLITVGATASTDLYAPWSNSGLQDVHIAAPGVNIISTGLQGGYLAMDGTGTAAPFVTGAAALLWSYNPTASVLQIKQALMAGVEAGPYPVQSRGRLNVARALAHLQAVMQP
jgi:subtilisin family serine protease